MTRWLLLSAALISLPMLTDAAVDFQFRYQHPDQDIGYSQTERDEMDMLVSHATGKKRRAILSGADEQVALRLLWGDGL